MALLEWLESARDNKTDVTAWLQEMRNATFRAGGGEKKADGLVEFHLRPTSPVQYALLPYVENCISYCVPDGEDQVLSGPFTGCLMTTFVQDGVRKVCHVFTSSNRQLDCKEKWAKIRQANQGGKTFKPSEHVEEVVKGRAFLGCYGLMTPASKCYRITLVHEENKPVVADVTVLGEYLLAEDIVQRARSSARKDPREYPAEFARKAATDFPR